jgi:hypothetical protein
MFHSIGMFRRKSGYPKHLLHDPCHVAKIKQTVLPSAETAVMLFWALLASGLITMRKVDG